MTMTRRQPKISKQLAKSVPTRWVAPKGGGYRGASSLEDLKSRRVLPPQVASAVTRPKQHADG